MKTAKLEDGTAVKFDEDNPLGQGAFGTVYPSADPAFVVKLYDRPAEGHDEILRLLIKAHNATRDLAQPERTDYWDSLFSWPKQIVLAPRLGVWLPRLPAGLVKLRTLLVPNSYKTLVPEQRRWNARVHAAWRLAQGVQRLHSLGLAHSDLSPNNIYANPETGHICIIDCDDLVVPGFNPSASAGTPRYIAPEVLEGRGVSNHRTDRHALSVLIHELLLFRHPLIGPFDHGLDDNDEIEQQQLGSAGIYIGDPKDWRNRPRKGFYRPELLGPTLAKLLAQAFGPGLRDPEARPTALQWQSALGRLVDRIVSCVNPTCDERYFPLEDGKRLACPWCKTPFPSSQSFPVFRLWDPAPKKPCLVEDFWIAGLEGRKLHGWHRQPKGSPGSFSDRVPIARVDYLDGRWTLVSLDAVGITTMDSRGNEVARLVTGQKTELTGGAVIRLGRPDVSRFISVHWLQ